jgi:quercetin dioxygenase-like cupin family protein
MPFWHGLDTQKRLGGCRVAAYFSDASGSRSSGIPGSELATTGRPTMIHPTLRHAAFALLATASFASPAFAGECPAGKSGMNELANHPTMPKGVTDTVLGSVDLGAEIGVADRQLRTRRLVVQPGGIVPFHSHMDRPALIYTVSGQITEYRSSCTVPILHKAGDIAREADGISHYWINHGKTAAVLLSSDVHHGM